MNIHHNNHAHNDPLIYIVRHYRYGDSTIRGISASVLSILSNNLEIVQQMFSYGAIKPILLLCNPETASEPELLAGFGCVVQVSQYLILVGMYLYTIVVIFHV